MRRYVSLAIALAASTAALAACGGDPATGNRVVPVQPGPGQMPVGGATGGAGTGQIGNVGNPTGPAVMAGSGAPRTGNDRCVAQDLMTQRVTPNVMLVVDGSTSMEMPYGTVDPMTMMPPAGAPSRWQAVREALVGASGVVPMVQGLVKFGLALYGTNAQCPLPMGVLPPALNNLPMITAGLPTTPPGMFTPTGLALDQVVDMMPDPTLTAPDKEPEPQIIVLATDGDPNACPSADIFAGFPMTDYAPSIAAAMKAQAKHLKMYVISVGMDASMTHLQEMANIGAGKAAADPDPAPVYLTMDPASLASALQTLIGREIPCEVTLNVISGNGGSAGKQCAGMVSVDGVPLECNGENGWELVDMQQIRLKGTACESFKANVSSVLNAKWPCDSLVE